MSKGKKIILIIAIAIVLIAVIGFLYVRSLARGGSPEYDGTVVLEGIQDEVIVYRDQYAIPHIYAKNENDLYRAVGYCYAQDRLWQMDLVRRVTMGRLSEIFGEDMVEADLLLRALRIPEKSRMLLDEMSEEMRRASEAFSDGVNQYMKSLDGDLPVEFAILGYAPEEWKPEHSANVIGYMAWDLTMPWDTEVVHHKIRQKVGAEMYRDIYPDIPSFTTHVYPEYAGMTELDLQHSLMARAQVLEDLGLVLFKGSNNWAISGKKSVTGNPVLCNDMHLGLFAPGIWYQMHQVVEGKLNVTGVMVPAQPFITCGHNAHIAWGMTNVMVDDMDFYVEKINPENPNEYFYKGKWRPLKVKKETILISGGKKVEKEIRFTHRGPIVSEFKKVKDAAISMRWIGNEKSNELRTVFLLNRAKNWEDFKNAVKTFISISQNIIYADTAGNIGLYCCAGIPIRKGNGITIQPGWTDEFDWRGLVPFEKRPNSFNPKSGFVSSANNKTVGNDYPYYISHWFDPPHRIDRIREMLTAKEKLSIEDLKKMHADQKSKMVEQLRPGIIEEMKRASDLTPLEKQCLEIFERWDGIMSREGSAPAIFEKFYLTFIQNVFADELGDDLYKEFIKQRIVPKYAVGNIWKNRSSAWCDDLSTEEKETFSDMIQKSFKSAVAWLADELGSTPEEWHWGDIHKLTLEHPLGSVAILNTLFGLNRGPYDVGGSFHTVCPYSYKLGNPFAVTDGASQRHIFPVDNWDKSLTVIPTGISGIPASDYYCDQAELYVNNQYHSDYASRELVEQNAKYKLIITGTEKK